MLIKFLKKFYFLLLIYLLFFSCMDNSNIQTSSQSSSFSSFSISSQSTSSVDSFYPDGSYNLKLKMEDSIALKLKMDNDLKLKLKLKLENDLKLKMESELKLKALNFKSLNLDNGLYVLVIDSKGRKYRLLIDDNTNYQFYLPINNSFIIYYEYISNNNSSYQLLIFSDGLNIMSINNNTNNLIDLQDIQFSSNSNTLFTKNSPKSFIDYDNDGIKDNIDNDDDNDGIIDIEDLDSDNDNIVDLFAIIDDDNNYTPDVIERINQNNTNLKEYFSSDLTNIENANYYVLATIIAADENARFYQTNSETFKTALIEFTLSTNNKIKNYQTNKYSNKYTNCIKEVILNTNIYKNRNLKYYNEYTNKLILVTINKDFRESIESKYLDELSNRIAEVVLNDIFTNFITSDLFNSYVEMKTLVTNNYDWVYSYFARISDNLYVSYDGDDLNYGFIQKSPFKSIQKAINIAVKYNKNNILVKSGLYYPGNGLNSKLYGVFITNNNIKLLGGWDNNFSNQSELSELDGTNGLYNIIYAANITNLFIDGFIIKNGYAKGTSAKEYGGGIYFYNVSFSTIYSNIIIMNNYAYLCGGGIYILEGKFNIINCQIMSNIANRGGGIFLSNCISNIVDGIISNNKSIYDGGGIYLSSGSYNKISSKIYNNNAGYSGGGIYSTNEIFLSVNSDIIDNFASYYGGGVYLSYGYSNYISGNVINNIVNNYDGGGIYIYRGSHNIITGNICGNIATTGGGIYVLNSDNLSIINSYITNNIGNMNNWVIVLYNSGNLVNLKMYNNYIGGNNNSYGIYELNQDIIGHELRYNKFITNQLKFLYRDIGKGDISIANWTNINNIDFTDATEDSINNEAIAM